MSADQMYAWSEEDKARFNLALFKHSDQPIAWIRADGKLLAHKVDGDLEDGQTVYPLYAHPAISADQGELIKRLMHRVGDYDDPDLCARGKYYTQSDKMVDRRIIAALQSAEAGRKDAERYAWLKERCEWRSLGVWRSLKLPEVPFSDGSRNSNAPDELDAAIDAAIAGK